MIYNLSIIIPFYNPKKIINQSLKNSIELANNFNIEIIYIDNNSDDYSKNIIIKKIKKIKKIKLFKTNKKLGMGPGVARNIGIRKAKSNLLLFLDVDDIIDINYMNLLMRRCRKFRDNFMYLEKKSKVKLSPYIKYNKHNIRTFF